MKIFSVPCQFGQSTANVTFYLGKPEGIHHPIHFQAAWLSDVKGGQVPQKIMDAIQKLKELAEKNGVSFEDLAIYAMKSATGASTDEYNQDYETIIEQADNPDENV